MARIRQFKPAFFTDDKVGKLSRDARLFFFGVLSEADDEGRLVDSPKRLAGVVFPFDDDVTPKKVERWINELVEQRMVVRYTHDGGRFLYVRKFKDHQRMSHPTPSTLPPPPPEPGQSSGSPPEIRRSDTGEPPEGFVPVFEGVSVSEGVFEGDPNQSSSSHHGDPPASADDDDGPGVGFEQAVAECVDRRMARAHPNDPKAYRHAVVLSVVDELGPHIRRMLAEGSTVAEVCDALEPVAAPAGAAAEQPPQPSREHVPSPFDEVWNPDTQRFEMVRVSA